MKPYIGGRPALRLGNLFQNDQKRCNIYPLDHEKCFYFFSARYALAALLKASGLKNGDEILVPSYNCGVEIDPILFYKIKPVFYNIKRDLSIDIQDLASKINKNVKAILITHYLGFPQPIEEIKKICEERDLFLIEDCAHALLSQYNGRPLGSFGDAAFFSLLKTLPVPNGGVLILNKPDLTYDNNQQKPSSFSTLFYSAELLHLKTRGDNERLEQTISRILITSVYLFGEYGKLLVAAFRKLFNPKALYLVRPDSYLFIEDLLSWGISDYSIKIMNNTDFGKIKISRRENFVYLLNHFLKNERGILPIKELHTGVCPLFFPIIVENAERRSDLYQRLKNRGIITHPWWDRFHPLVPWDEFPDAVYLKQRLFGLPIHQDLTLKHLDYLLSGFEEVLGSR